MAVHPLKRRLAAPGTVLGLGIALLFAVGVTPAYAQSELSITKSHTGNFPRSGQGVYTIAVVNDGVDTTFDRTRMTDNLPQGVSFGGLTVAYVSPGTTGFNCAASSNTNRVDCVTDPLPPGEGYRITVTVNVAADAPCTVVNTASVVIEDSFVGDTANDPTNIPGPDCNGGGGGSLLPITLDGVIPMYNNITTNSNINSPGAANVSNQDFAVNAP